ncbi:hypothetical protein D3C79_946700 [compost metagenome]
MIRQTCREPYSGTRVLACWTELWIVPREWVCRTTAATLATSATTDTHAATRPLNGVFAMRISRAANSGPPSSIVRKKLSVV